MSDAPDLFVTHADPFLVRYDTSAHRTFRLAHVPGDPLVGVQIAAIKDSVRQAWAARPNPDHMASVLVAGVTMDQMTVTAAQLGDELGAHVRMTHARPRPSCTLWLKPLMSRRHGGDETR